MNKIRYIDLFAGIGGTRLGLEQACDDLGISTECVLSSEIDSKAQETYEMNFNDKVQGDIKEISEIPNHDFVLAGFPCQPFSYAGKQRGFGDTRGTLFFDVERFLKEAKPKFFLLENVRGLTTHDNGRTFNTIVKSLEDIGYGVNYLLLNSSLFGVPQNRVRIYILGHLGNKPKLSISSNKGAADSHSFKKSKDQKSFFGNKQIKIVKDVLEKSVDEKYYCSDEFTNALHNAVSGDFEKLHGMRLSDYRNGNTIHSWELGLKGNCSKDEIDFLNSLIKNRRKKKFGTHKDGKRLSPAQIKTFFDHPKLGKIIKSLEEKGYIKQVDGKYNPVAGNMSFEVYKFLDPESISLTLVSSDAHKLGVVVDRPRRITPREAARIQGFPDDFILHPEDNHTYKQLGNSVSVPVIKSLVKDLLENNL